MVIISGSFEMDQFVSVWHLKEYGIYNNKYKGSFTLSCYFRGVGYNSCDFGEII
jgi:hypothetical protein